MRRSRLLLFAALSGLACSEIAGFDDFTGDDEDVPQSGGASGIGGSTSASGAAGRTSGGTASAEGGQAGSKGGSAPSGGSGTGGSLGTAGEGEGGSTDGGDPSGGSAVGGSTVGGSGNDTGGQNTGGGTSTGGTVSTGGSSDGGEMNTGGTGPNTGGAAQDTGGTGGASTGGATTGGTNTGGTNTGGTNTGGASTGGASTGGSKATGGTGGVGGCDAQLLQNAGFESGDTIWAPYTSWGSENDLIMHEDDPQLDSEGVVPFAGEWLAWLGGIPNTETDHTTWLLQYVTIPAGATSLHLTGRIRIDSEEFDGQVNDLLHLEIMDAPEDVRWLWHTWDNLDESPVWQQIVVEPLDGDDLDALGLRGATLPIQLRSDTDEAGITSFWVDDLRLYTECGN